MRTKDPRRMINTNLIINFKWNPFVRRSIFHHPRRHSTWLFFSFSLRFCVATIPTEYFLPAGRRLKLVAIQMEKKRITRKKHNRKQRQNEITKLRNWKILPLFYGSMRIDEEPNPSFVQSFLKSRKSYFVRTLLEGEIQLPEIVKIGFLKLIKMIRWNN